MPDPELQNLDVLVVSFGGVGTSFLMRFLQKYLTINDVDDLDGLKHLSVVPRALNPRTKIIYIYGNPVCATRSLFRREYHYAQAKKNGNPSILPLETTLGDYAKNGSDELYLIPQFTAWYAHFQHPNPICYIKYEKIHDHIPELLAFLELPGYLRVDFPKRRQRSSQTEDRSEPTQTQLENIYSQLSQTMDALPAVVVNNDLRSSRIKVVKQSLTTFLPFIKVYLRLFIRFLLRRKPNQPTFRIKK